MRDLDRLFVWLRFKSAPLTVKDVGHFVAHIEDRDRGSAWEGAQAYIDLMNYHLFTQPVGFPENCSLDILIRLAKANVAIAREEVLQKRLGLDRKRFAQAVRSALKKFKAFEDGRLKILKNFTERESKVIDFCFQRLVIDYYMRDTDLVSDFCDSLQSNGLIDAAGRAAISQHSREISLFVLEKLHLARAKVPGGKTAVFNLCWDREQDYILLTATLPDLWKPNVFIIVPFFSTGVGLAEGVGPQLSRVLSTAENRAQVACPLELTEDWKLEILA